jgi:hypothetical protein
VSLPPTNSLGQTSIVAGRSEGLDWYLGNAEEEHAANPRSFLIPGREERSNRNPGDLVRLLFFIRNPPAEGPRAERMWLEVSARDEDSYVGLLTNRPIAIKDLLGGDEVAFRSEHIIAIQDPKWTPYENLLAFANRRLIEDDSLEPGYVVHDPSDLNLDPTSHGERASGWHLLVGDETDKVLEDPDSELVPNLAWLMERYPAFAELVFSGARDGEWELDRTTGRYRRPDS